MKRSWMAIALLLSVGVNIGVLATLGVSRIRDREPEPREWRRPERPRVGPSAERLADRLGLEGASRETFLEQHRRFFDTVGRLRSELSETRRALRQEVGSPAPDEARIEALLAESARLTAELDRAFVDNVLVNREILDADQQRAYFAFIGRQRDRAPRRDPRRPPEDAPPGPPI